MGKKNLIDCIITIENEKVRYLGEDSTFTAYREPLGVMGVFDGCGGIGAKKYPMSDNHSGAYLASKSAMNATEKWFSHIENFDKNDTQRLSDSLKEHICQEFNHLSSDDGALKGSLVCEFPTTVSVALVKQLDDAVLSAFFWAGDSRGYIFEPKGLIQLTRDNIVGSGDAYTNLREDARLSNFARGDGDFYLSRRIAEIKPPAMIICATDGCFGYFKTPMEFEYTLLKEMESAKSFDEWKDLLTETLKGVSGDDLSMNICVIGCKNIEKAKKVYKKRRKYLYKNYISKMKNADEKMLQGLWNEYKEEYYG